MMWHALHSCGVGQPIPGYGRLLMLDGVRGDWAMTKDTAFPWAFSHGNADLSWN
jgi:hypothetical protein